MTGGTLGIARITDFENRVPAGSVRTLVAVRRVVGAVGLRGTLNAVIGLLLARVAFPVALKDTDAGYVVVKEAWETGAQVAQS